MVVKYQYWSAVTYQYYCGATACARSALCRWVGAARSAARALCLPLCNALYRWASVLRALCSVQYRTPSAPRSASGGFLEILHSVQLLTLLLSACSAVSSKEWA
jgi:hypothetical protein